LFLAVLLMTVPALAVSNVDITCAKDGNGVIVSYTSDVNRIRAFGLDITVTGANITKLEVLDPNYRIYPGQIVIVAGDVCDYNTPYAPGDLGDANVTVEMGSLYTLDPCYAGDPDAGYRTQPPGLSGDLLKFYPDSNCTYDVNENPTIGGVVMEDPNEDPNVSTCNDEVYECIVPDVVNMTQADAEAAIEAEVFTVSITTDCNNTIADGNVISTNPAAGATPGCGTEVEVVVSTGECCFPSDDPNWGEWVKVGKPDCWCYPRQCLGDTDNASQGKSNYWVASDDLTLLLSAWSKPIEDMSGNEICADFDHLPQGKSNYRVASDDLVTLLANWSIPNGPDPNCP